MSAFKHARFPAVQQFGTSAFTLSAFQTSAQYVSFAAFQYVSSLLQHSTMSACQHISIPAFQPSTSLLAWQMLNAEIQYSGVLEEFSVLQHASMPALHHSNLPVFQHVNVSSVSQQVSSIPPFPHSTIMSEMSAFQHLSVSAFQHFVITSFQSPSVPACQYVLCMSVFKHSSILLSCIQVSCQKCLHSSMTACQHVSIPAFQHSSIPAY